MAVQRNQQWRTLMHPNYVDAWMPLIDAPNDLLRTTPRPLRYQLTMNLASTTGGSNHAVVLTRPGGGDWVVVGVESWPTGPVYYTTRYAANDPTHATARHETTTHAEALAVVLNRTTE